MTRCVVMLLCTDTHVLSVESLDEMDNCGTGGWDCDTDWLTEGAVDVSVRRTVPVIGSVSKEGGRRSKLSHKPVNILVAINFVLWTAECEWYDLKFSVLIRVVNCNSCFFLLFQHSESSGLQTHSPPWKFCEMGIKFYQTVMACISVQLYPSICAVFLYSLGNFLCSFTSAYFFKLYRSCVSYKLKSGCGIP